MTTVDFLTDSPTNKRRKYDHSATMLDTDTEGWQSLQPILENDVLCAKIPTSESGFDLLTKWFQIIAGDQEKLRLFREWIAPTNSEDFCPSSENKESILPIPLSEIKKDVDEAEHERLCANLTPTSISSTSPSKPSSPCKSPESPSSPPTVAAATAASSSSSSSSSPSPSHLSPPSPPSSASTSRSASIDFITNEIPITPRSTPQVLLLQQLLQQQQQQIVLLQKLQNNSTESNVSNTITLNPASGSAGVLLTVSIKGGQWHAYSDACSCTCGFSTMDGTITSANRVPGGGEGAMCFVVPNLPLPVPSPGSVSAPVPLVVHLTPCSSPHSVLVCASSFMYARERVPGASSDDDSEGTPDGSLCDDEGDDEDTSGENASPATALSSSSSSSPKQLMTIRERMMEYVGAHAKSSMRVIVSQQPPTRVVWKNRRLDTPFKIRVDGVSNGEKVSILALVVDHKGKLQIDAMENYEEECGAQGNASFHNLRMTKGTWGKEWSITFVAVKGSSTDDPVITGVSQPCPVVVKTRKNPQVRNIHRGDSTSPVSFIERKPGGGRKRNRVEDLIDPPLSASSSPSTSASSASSSSSSSSASSSSTSRGGLHTEAMNSLLYAAEIKHQEREFQSHPVPPSSSPLPANTTTPSRQALMLPSIQSGFGGSSEPNFANLQSLMSFLEEVKHKYHPKLSIVEQPQLKREGNVLIVKKGKPFRTPFRLQMRIAPLPSQRADYSPTPDYNPQQYVCVAVLRNDKGEEVALKNSEVSFDGRGLATFSGLMVMKGTWGKTVQLTFEARWAGAKRLAGGNNWPPLRMLVISETPALQLMCYTKDKKISSSSG